LYFAKRYSPGRTWSNFTRLLLVQPSWGRILPLRLPPAGQLLAGSTFEVVHLSWGGAKRARTADLLHAIWRQHVHPRPYPQVTVLPRPRKSARVRVCCCTSVLYRSIRAAPPVAAPDEALTSVKPLRQVTDAPSCVHPVKQALEVGPRHSPAASPNPSPDRSLARRQTPSRAHRGLDRNFRFCRCARVGRPHILTCLNFATETIGVVPDGISVDIWPLDMCTGSSAISGSPRGGMVPRW
jgi:hypothetical protein